jgi:broad specificity phosphatase PhoE
MRPTRRLLLVRHGLPDYRDGKPGDEFPGPPLAEIGYLQAAQAATSVSAFGPAAIYSSPLTRARQTAEVIRRQLRIPLCVDSDLTEWHHTEFLHEVSVRLTRWLVHWLRRDEPCAVAVSHASPLLAILRSALYLPHVCWHKTGTPELLETSSGDRFEVSMASVFEVVFEAEAVTARCVSHPEPRIHHFQAGVVRNGLPQLVPGGRESQLVRRANWLHLIGVRSPLLP